MTEQGDKLKKLLEEVKEKAAEKSEEVREALREHDHNRKDDKS